MYEKMVVMLEGHGQFRAEKGIFVVRQPAVMFVTAMRKEAPYPLSG